MSDEETGRAYAANAAIYSKDWLDQPPPDDLYKLLQLYFIEGGKTADIGCGNGRDAAWLAAHHYPTVGFDNSLELLAEARWIFPTIRFQRASLPKLTEITEQFDNVLCETVIMHLAVEEILDAIANLQRIVKESGVLYLSWRVTEGSDQRHADGRLYTAFDPALIRDALQAWSILHVEDVQSLSSGKRICRIIAKKPAPHP
jgi:SAM-dependent methyltransferase